MKKFFDRVLDSFPKTLIALVILSFVSNLVIECLARHNILKGLRFIITNPYMFLLGTLMILTVLCLVFFIPKRSFAFILPGSLYLIIGFCNWYVTRYRDMPFSFTDIMKVKSVVGVTLKYFSIWEVVGICVGVAAAIFALVMLGIHSKKRPVVKYLKFSIPAFLVSGSLCALLIVAGRANGIIEKPFPQLIYATEEYGYVYTFSCSVTRRGVHMPEEFTPKTAMDISKMLDDICPNTSTGETGTQGAMADPIKANVIIVQLESFFDPTYLKYASYSEDPIPNYRALKSTGISGLMEVNTVGAGTVNTEFEILSGMSLDYFGPGEYPFRTVMTEHTTETIAYNLHNLGYTSHFIHNNDGDFYDRNEIYARLGFDTFTSMEFMQGLEFNTAGTWPKDQILTGQILSALERTTGPDLVMTVAVQSHGKYPAKTMPEGHEYRIQATVSPMPEEIEEPPIDEEALTYYVNELYEVDLFVKDLYEAVMALDEKTVLVLYGDHLPSLGITDEMLSIGNILQNEYVVVSNFGMEKVYAANQRSIAEAAGVASDPAKSAHSSDAENTESTGTLRAGDPDAVPSVPGLARSITSAPITFGDIYDYQLYALVLNECGIHEGLFTRLHQFCRDKAAYQDWLNMLEYDMLGNNADGELRNVFGGYENYFPEIEMFFGPEDLAITKACYEDGYLLVFGNGFTEYSFIYDGSKLGTPTENSEESAAQEDTAAQTEISNGQESDQRESSEESSGFSIGEFLGITPRGTVYDDTLFLSREALEQWKDLKADQEEDKENSLIPAEILEEVPAEVLEALLTAAPEEYDSILILKIDEENIPETIQVAFVTAKGRVLRTIEEE